MAMCYGNPMKLSATSLVLIAIVMGQVSSLAVNSTSSIKPPSVLKNSSRPLTADQLAQEQRLALQIITTDSLNLGDDRSHVSNPIETSASAPSRSNNKIDRLSSVDLSETDDGAIAFDNQLSLMDEQLKKNQESVSDGEQFKIPKRIIINLNTGSSAPSNSSQNTGKGTKITIGFADGPESEPLRKERQLPKTASNRRDTSIKQRTGGADMRRALVEALQKQGGLPAMIMGQGEFDGLDKVSARKEPRVKLMMNAEVIDQVRGQVGGGQQSKEDSQQVTRAAQSSASTANDITLREAIENLSNEINSLEKQFDKDREEPGDHQRKEDAGTLSKHASSQSISEQAVHMINSDESDTESAENLQRHQDDDSMAQNPSAAYGLTQKPLVLSNDNIISEEEGANEIADESFADSNQSRLRAIHDGSNDGGRDVSLHGSEGLAEIATTPMMVARQSAESADETMRQPVGDTSQAADDTEGNQNYESTRTLTGKSRIEKVDGLHLNGAETNALRLKQYHRPSLLMANSLMLNSQMSKTSEDDSKSDTVNVVAGRSSADLTRLGPLRKPAKQVDSENGSENNLDERVARILEELKLYTTKEQLVKVVRDLLQREQLADESLKAPARVSAPAEASAGLELDRYNGEQRNLKVSSPVMRNHRRRILDAVKRTRLHSLQMDHQETPGPKKSFQEASSNGVVEVAHQRSQQPAGNDLVERYVTLDAARSSNKESPLVARMGTQVSSTEPQKRRWMRDIGTRLLWDFRKRQSNLKAMLDSSEAEAASIAGQNAENGSGNNQVYHTKTTPGLNEAEHVPQKQAPTLQDADNQQAFEEIRTEPAEDEQEIGTQGSSTREGINEYTTNNEYHASMKPHDNQVYNSDQQQQQADSQNPEASRSIESYVPIKSYTKRESVDQQQIGIQENSFPTMESTIDSSRLHLKGIAEIKAIEKIIDELMRREQKDGI